MVSSGPATFTAISVLDRVMERARVEKEWLVILDRLANAFLATHTDSDQPLLVVAALHPEAHLLPCYIIRQAAVLRAPPQ